KPTPASLVAKEGHAIRPPQAVHARPVVATRPPQDLSHHLRAAGLNPASSAAPPPRLVHAPRPQGGGRQASFGGRAAPPPPPAARAAREATSGAGRRSALRALGRAAPAACLDSAPRPERFRARRWGASERAAGARRGIATRSARALTVRHRQPRRDRGTGGDAPDPRATLAK